MCYRLPCTAEDLGNKKEFTSYFNYQPAQVIENREYNINLDKEIITHRQFEQNRPDINIVDKTKKKVVLVDISIPNNYNMQNKHNDYLHKYSKLRRQILGIGNMKTVSIISLIVLSTGLIPKSLIEYLVQLIKSDSNIIL